MNSQVCRGWALFVSIFRGITENLVNRLVVILSNLSAKMCFVAAAVPLEDKTYSEGTSEVNNLETPQA